MPQFEHYRVRPREDGTPWVLGRGGMGVTYRAIDTKLGREVALKVIDSNRLLDEAGRHRFLREAKANAMLHHRNLAAVFHQGQVGDACYYAMELIEGRTLQEILRERGRLPPLEALEITRQAAQALSEAERHGLVHRDVKPANLMIKTESDGEMLVKLIDFGLVKAVMSEQDATQITIDGGYLGTAMTSSPEQCRGEDLDSRSDIYSLGIVLWNMLEGRPPYEDPNHFRLMMAHLELPLPIERLAGLPGPLVDLVAGMLAKRREDRPANTSELLKRIAAATTAVGAPASAPPARFVDPATAPPPPPPAAAPEAPPESPAPPRRGRVVAAAALVLLAGALAYGIHARRPPRPPPPANHAPAAAPVVGFLELLGEVESRARAGDWARALARAAELTGRAATDERRREVETAVEALALKLLAEPDLVWGEALRAHAAPWRAWVEAAPRPAARLALVRALRAGDPAEAARLLEGLDPAAITDQVLRLEHAAARRLAADGASAQAAADAAVDQVLEDLRALPDAGWARARVALLELSRVGHPRAQLALARRGTDPAEAQALRMEAARSLETAGAVDAALEAHLELFLTNTDPGLAAAVREHPERLLRRILDAPATLSESAFQRLRPLWERAAEQGLAAAAEALGARHLQADPSAAATWFRRAADAGSASAMAQLSLLHDQGRGVPADPALARSWLEKAAATGHPAAQTRLALALQGKADEASRAAAADWLEKAVGQGFHPAREALAELLRQGRGRPADPARARELLRAAAEGGQASAYGSLAAMTRAGEGGPADPAAALALFAEGARHGDPWCQYQYGAALWHGQGVAADPARATPLLQAAARAGLPDAVRFCAQVGVTLP
jgi:TPR repeat protein/tRNA A-37 threonylcarbamoyl transferase component Bud32